MATLRAGLARSTLRPERRAYLIGYGNRWRGSTGVRDDLCVTALVLEEAGPGEAPRRAALLAFDLLCLHEDVVARIRARLAGLGLPPEAVMVACSHTHHAPVAHPGSRLAWRRRRWIEHVVEAAGAAAARAAAALAPVELAAARGETRIAVNRRERRADGSVTIGVDPDGFVDRSLHLVALRAPDGALRGTLLHLACHPTVLGPGNREATSEWPGVARRALEAATGAPCLFLQGATADLNPAHAWGADDEAALERVGRSVADAGIALLGGALEPLAATPLATERGELAIPVVPRRRPDGRLESYRETASRRLGIPRPLVDPLLAYAYPWRPRLRRAAGGLVFPMELQALRAGELALVGCAAEVFSEIGAAVTRSSPFSATLFLGLANGCVGYLPTAAACAAGGYEVEEALLAYRVSGTFAPDTEALVTDRCRGLLRSLRAPAA
jgi:neutral ceramidase